MPYKQLIQIGRLCVHAYGQLADSLCVIVDIVDNNRVVADVVGSTRQVIPIKRLKTTEFLVDVTKGTDSEAVLKKAQKEIDGFYQTKWGKRLLAEKNKYQLNDFQRFKHQKIANKFRELVLQNSKSK